MSFALQLIVALALIAMGIIPGFFKIRDYMRDEKQAVKEDFLDMAFGFFPEMIYCAGSFLIGAGWLTYLFVVR